MQNYAIVNKDNTNELSCVIISTLGEQLLLPNICIAEIIKSSASSPCTDGPDWVLGLTGWRGQTLPIVHYGRLNGAQYSETDEMLHTRCMVVMNRARSATGPAFYALAATCLPRMVQLTDEDLNNDTETLGCADVMRVRVGTEVATIPDLSYVEHQLAALDLTPS